MPETPIYEPGQVTPRPLPGPRFSASAGAASFGGAQAQQLGQAGAALEQVATLAGKLAVTNQERINNTKSEDIYNQYTDAVNVLMETDVKMRRAKDADKTHDYTKLKIGELKKKFTKGLDNDRQRELFGRAADRSEVGYLNTALRHQQQELRRYEEQVGKQSITQSVRNAVASIDTPVLLEIELINGEEKIREKVPKFESNKGMPDTFVEADIARNTHMLYTAVLDAYGRKSAGAALIFYRAKKGKFDVLDVKQEGRLMKAAEGEWVWGKAKELSGSGMPLEQQLKEVDAIVLGEPNDFITASGVATLRSEVIKRERIKNLTAKANAQVHLDARWAGVKKQGKDAVVPNDVSWEEQKKMRAYIDKEETEWANNLTLGPPSVTTAEGWSQFGAFMNMSSEQLAKQDIYKFIHMMALPEFNRLDTQWRSSRSNISSEEEKVVSTRTDYQQARGAIAGMSYFDPEVKSQPGRNVSAEHVKKREGWFFAQFDKHLTLIPKEERTTERKDKMLAEELLADVHISRGFGRAKLKIKKFEIPYLSDVGFAEEEVAAALEQRPEELKKHTELQYSPSDNVYFLDIKGGTARDVFDRITGAYITTIPIGDIEEEDFTTITIGDK